MTSSIDRLLDLPLPVVKGDPEDVHRRRVLSGAGILGFWVAVGAILLQLVADGGAGVWPVVAFAVGAALIPAMTRAGVPTGALRLFGLALVSVFMVVDSLLGTTMDWQQLKWLTLLPLITRYLWDPSPEAQGQPRHRIGPLGAGGILTLVLAIGVVVAHAAGLHGNDVVLTGDSANAVVSGLVDLALYVASIAGLFAVYDRSLRRADAEVQMLRSLLSMCAWCRRIHDEDDGWVSVERYMRKHASAQLSHGMCPECSAKAMASLG